MRILVLGDVVGKPGRRAVADTLPYLVDQHHPDFVVLNGENAAGGMGLTPEITRELLSYGVDCITTGNHVFDKRDIYPTLSEESRLLRPANYPEGAPGRGLGIYTTQSGKKVAVISLMGRVFMEPLDSPFQVGRRLVDQARAATPIVLVDLHAEATSEKQAVGWYLDGRVSLVFGTHTHVPTADERVLPAGTAYITDIGMTGTRDSVLGFRKEVLLGRFLSNMPAKFEVAEGEVVVSGILVEIDEETGKAESITRVSESWEPQCRW
ncbi:MAG TPA: TIGR00282 family metallophosphoesterase [Armatimonadota bacterium]